MTGFEIAAAGKAVQMAGKAALEQDDGTGKALVLAAQETIEFKSAARAMAARSAVKERIKLKLYKPFALMLGVSKLYFEETFPEEMAQKTATIPDENLVTPPASVAVPALHGLSYTFNEPDLKEMYLNLLVTASDNRRADIAHPAFAEIIKQLSASEVSFLDSTLRRGALPIVRLRIYSSPTEPGYIVAETHLMETVNLQTGEPGEEVRLPAWIDNWVRLGLLDVSYIRYVIADGAYDWVVKHPAYGRTEQELAGGRLQVEKGMIQRTAFGERFLKAVSAQDET